MKKITHKKDHYQLQEEMASGKPGILIGRYPGDSYAGGNPWQGRKPWKNKIFVVLFWPSSCYINTSINFINIISSLYGLEPSRKV